MSRNSPEMMYRSLSLIFVLLLAACGGGGGGSGSGNGNGSGGDSSNPPKQTPVCVRWDVEVTDWPVNSTPALATLKKSILVQLPYPHSSGEFNVDNLPAEGLSVVSDSTAVVAVNDPRDGCDKPILNGALEYFKPTKLFVRRYDFILHGERTYPSMTLGKGESDCKGGGTITTEEGKALVSMSLSMSGDEWDDATVKSRTISDGVQTFTVGPCSSSPAG